MKYLIPLLFPLAVLAETTGNLITNGTFESGNSNGWTKTGDVTVLSDCCGSNYDLEFGDSGSIEQSFSLIDDVITQPMLDNGITLNSSVLMQNGECAVAGCWGGSGPADSFSIRLQIRDEDNEVLSTTTQERYNVTGINGETFTDSLSYTGVGSNLGNIVISGTDSNSPANLGGPNVDNISVTMTYDPTVLTVEQTQEIAAIFEEIEEVFIFEEVVLEYIALEEMPVEIIEEVPVLTVEEQFIEETIVLAPEMMIEEPIEITEEIYEEIEAPMEEASVEAEETIEPTETIEETTVADSSSADDVTVTVEDITIKVAEKIKTIDGQLKATQMIIAKVMQNNSKIASYAKVNAEIFVQPQIKDINIDSYIASSYVDIRQIYSNQTYEDRLWTSRQ